MPERRSHRSDPSLVPFLVLNGGSLELSHQANCQFTDKCRSLKARKVVYGRASTTEPDRRCFFYACVHSVYNVNSH